MAASPDERKAASGSAPAPRERRELLARAHQLKAKLTVGRQGLSDAFVAQVRQAFENADLLKVRIDSDDRHEAMRLAAELARRVGCRLLQRVGRIAVLHRLPAET